MCLSRTYPSPKPSRRRRGSGGVGALLAAPSFDGGGFNGMGPRSGGIDRKGFPAMLPPNASVIDHKKRQGGQGVEISSTSTPAALPPSVRHPACYPRAISLSSLWEFSTQVLWCPQRDSNSRPSDYKSDNIKILRLKEIRRMALKALFLLCKWHHVVDTG